MFAVATPKSKIETILLSANGVNSWRHFKIGELVQTVGVGASEALANRKGRSRSAGGFGLKKLGGKQADNDGYFVSPDVRLSLQVIECEQPEGEGPTFSAAGTGVRTAMARAATQKSGIRSSEVVLVANLW